jgi:hypothetical protein
MLVSLKRLQEEQKLDGQGLRAAWHKQMKSHNGVYWKDFFSCVGERAKEVIQHFLYVFLGLIAVDSQVEPPGPTLLSIRKMGIWSLIW